ncbi:MAG: DUF6580 family putative transport protein [Patescibacteria group bacterium]|jgi:hypothetical protein
MKNNRWFVSLAVLVFVMLTVLMRLVPHPYNFIPMGALALFCGTYVRSRWGVVIPLVAMVVSDSIIGWHNLVLFTWGSYFFFGMIGWWVRRNKHVGRIAAGTIAGSVLFYAITNFAVWAFTPLYSKTLAGLVQSYVMAVPFYRNTFFGDIFYVSVFFGVYELVKYAMSKRPVSTKVVERAI